MSPREVTVTIMLGPGVFLYCASLLGMVNAILQLVLRTKLLDPEFVLVGRWGLGPTMWRLWRARIAQSASDFSSVTVAVARVQVFAAVGAGLTAILVLGPLPVPRSWLAGAGAAIGVLTYSSILWRGIRAVARPRLSVYGRLVNRPASATAELAAFLYRVWTTTVYVAWALSAVFLLTRLVTTAPGRPNAEIPILIGVALLAAFATIPVVLLVNGMVDEFCPGPRGRPRQASQPAHRTWATHRGPRHPGLEANGASFSP